MLKPKTINLADSNIANLGSDLEKKVKAAAAQKEHAWDNAGTAVGLQVWRIEKFHVRSWPKEQYGAFFSGDSYIVLNTWKLPDSPALKWDVHFWLGEHTTQDEAGTAAYKTVELDDRLGGAPVQHREVQGYESDMFLSYFNHTIRIMSGGMETGFKHVGPKEYVPRLLHIKGKKHVRCTEVNRVVGSLNSGDCFLLDMGLKIYQWNGSSSGGMEKNKAATLVRSIDDNEREGKSEVVVISEGDEPAEFWAALGGTGPVKSAAAGGADDVAKMESNFDKHLFRVSDNGGKLAVAEIKPMSRSALNSGDVFLIDAGNEIIVWVGKNSSPQERKMGLPKAQEYLTQHNRDPHIHIARIVEGGEVPAFAHYFH